MQLPLALRDKIETLIDTADGATLAADAARVSDRYRRREGGQNLQIRSRGEALSYLAARLPATYCAAVSVIREVHARLPAFSPASLLDAGAGPATATLAALAAWPKLGQGTLVEPNAEMRTAGQQLLADLHPSFAARWEVQELIATPPLAEKADLVIAGYALNEIYGAGGKAALLRTVQSLWAQTQGVLIFIEPGTPLGQNTLLLAREALLQNGASIVAPCPHEQACPLAQTTQEGQRWCHFSVRVERSRNHKRVKANATVGYEDEKFSYLVVSKDEVARPALRLIGQPRGKKVIEVEACRATATIEKLTIAKSSPLHDQLRRAEWGDGF